MARNGLRRYRAKLFESNRGIYLLFVFSNPPCRFFQLDLGPIPRSDSRY
jgi:hypothetical protein